MKKRDFLKIIKENNGIFDQGTVDKITSNISKVTQSVNGLNNSVKQLKDMGVVEEDLIDNENPNSKKQFFMKTIDELMHKLYGVTYYNKNNETNEEPLNSLSDQDLNNKIESVDRFGIKPTLRYVVALIKKYDTANDEKGLRDVYLMLQDGVRNSLRENLVDSEVFSIIAEAETAKISKKEILEFLNRK